MDTPNEKLLQEFRTVMAAAEELLGTAGEQGSERLEQLRELVRKNPLAAVAIAAAAGALLGVLLTRK